MKTLCNVSTDDVLKPERKQVFLCSLAVELDPELQLRTHCSGIEWVKKPVLYAAQVGERIG